MNKEEIQPNALYSTEEAAKLLGLKVQTIQKYVRENKIEATIIGGKWYRIPGASLLRFIEESKQYQIIPCSWHLIETGKWTPRADIIENLGDRVNVRNWEWKNQAFDSKEAADFYAGVCAKRKLLRDNGVED